MLILGINGGSKFEDEYDDNGIAFHDSAAALLRDGEIVACIEEERLSRIKHSNCFPIRAIQHCLQAANSTLDQVDIIAMNYSAFQADLLAKLAVIEDRTNQVPPDGRSQLAALFQRAFGLDVGDKLHFCNHHLAHAWSAFAVSGYDDSLILSIDGDGDTCSGMVLIGSGRRITKLQEFTIQQSLGRLYEALIRVLGYSCFDEYKAMGLAPYGDPKTYSSLFEKCYRLLPNGDYLIEPLKTWFAYIDSVGLIRKARRKGAPFTQAHKDFAAALQSTIEKIVLHVLEHYQRQTQRNKLCLAGGVAHNCTMNGKVLLSGLFEDVFVQPAAHDAGGAVGAALSALYEYNQNAQAKTLTHLYFGTDLGNSISNLATLQRWSKFICYEEEENIAARGAQLLVNGAVIGWVQGQSEFGPRALGNRSILADPRPSENKLRINQMVKKREEFRPFAPSVLEERVAEFFDAPPNKQQFPFMVFVLSVREKMRGLLGAVTHVDGTARVQTVSQKTNPLYWQLISEFEKLTGIPILLNTSFNNNAEPIVNSLDEAITCFLTTGLDVLIAGNYVVVKKSEEEILTGIRTLIPRLPVFRKLVKRRRDINSMQYLFEIESTKNKYFGTVTCEISAEIFEVLQRMDGQTNIGDLLNDSGIASCEHHRLLCEVIDLWSRRILQLHPTPVMAH